MNLNVKENSRPIGHSVVVMDGGRWLKKRINVRAIKVMLCTIFSPKMRDNVFDIFSLFTTRETRDRVLFD